MDSSDFNNWRNNPPAMTLKTLFFAHFIFICWSLFGSWMTTSYIFYNAVFMFLFASGILVKDKCEALEMTMAVNLISAVFDIVSLAMYSSSRGVFAKTGALLNMLLRVISHFVINKEITTRKEGGSNTFYGGSGPYQNIDDAPTV